MGAAGSHRRHRLGALQARRYAREPWHGQQGEFARRGVPPVHGRSDVRLTRLAWDWRTRWGPRGPRAPPAATTPWPRSRAEGCSAPSLVGQRSRRWVRAPRPPARQGAVLPQRIDRVPHRRGRRRADGRRPARPAGRDRARGDRWARGLFVHRGYPAREGRPPHRSALVQRTRGIGTYVRSWPRLWRPPTPPSSCCPSSGRGSRAGPSEARLRAAPGRGGVASLDPGPLPAVGADRPPLRPPRLRDATSCTRRTRPRSPPLPADSMIVTVHDLAFMRYPELFLEELAALVPAGLRAVASAAVLTPSSSTAMEHASTPTSTRRGYRTPGGLPCPAIRRRRRRRARPSRCAESIRAPVGTLEPRKNQARPVRAYRRLAADHPHAVLNGPDGMARRGLR